MLIMNVVSESFLTKHTFLLRTQLISARSYVLGKATSMLVLNFQKNAFVEIIFLEKLHPSNLTVTWIAVETSLISAAVETD